MVIVAIVVAAALVIGWYAHKYVMSVSAQDEAINRWLASFQEPYDDWQWPKSNLSEDL